MQSKSPSTVGKNFPAPPVPPPLRAGGSAVHDARGWHVLFGGPDTLDVSLVNPRLVSLIRDEAQRFERTPRMLVIEILEAVFEPVAGHSMVAGLLDER